MLQNIEIGVLNIYGLIRYYLVLRAEKRNFRINFDL